MISVLHLLFFAFVFQHHVLSLKAISTLANQRIITTIAGINLANFTGDDISATTAALNGPASVAIDASGSLYIADMFNRRIRKVDAVTKIITTIAGTGVAGFFGDDGVATKARLNSPSSVTLDILGNIYISDYSNDRIRRVDAVTNIITTVAGTIRGGFSADGILATTSELYGPNGVAFDASGNFYIADSMNNRIRKVDAVTKIITTVAGTGVAGYSGGNGVAATTARLDHPSGLSIDVSGNIYIADSNNNLIRRVDAATNIITTVAGTGAAGFNGDNINAKKAEFRIPSGIAIDATGNIFVADRGNSRVRIIDAVTHNVTTYAGSGVPGYSNNVPATSARLVGPVGVAVDAAGNVVIADFDGNRVRYIFDHSFAPTQSPTPAPSTAAPSSTPTRRPTRSLKPTRTPTAPTVAPTFVPTAAPVLEVSISASLSPSSNNMKSATTQPSGKGIASSTDAALLGENIVRPAANFRRNIAIGVVVGAFGVASILAGVVYLRARKAKVSVSLVTNELIVLILMLRCDVVCASHFFISQSNICVSFCNTVVRAGGIIRTMRAVKNRTRERDVNEDFLSKEIVLIASLTGILFDIK